MSSLKQKIQENTAIIYNILRSIEHEKHHTFPSGLIAHQDDKVLLLSDVLGLWDEARQQIREIDNDLDAEIHKFGYEGVYPTLIPCEADLVGQKRAIRKVLAVLEGAEQK